MFVGLIFFLTKRKCPWWNIRGKIDLFLIEYHWEDSTAKFKPLNCQYLYIPVKEKQGNFLIFHYEIRWKQTQELGGLNITDFSHLSPSLSQTFFPLQPPLTPTVYRDFPHTELAPQALILTSSLTQGTWPQFPHLENGECDPCPNHLTEVSTELIW